MKDLKHTYSYAFFNIIWILILQRFFSFWVACNIALGITAFISILWEIIERDNVERGFAYAFVGYVLAGITLYNPYAGLFVAIICFLVWFVNNRKWQDFFKKGR